MRTPSKQTLIRKWSRYQRYVQLTEARGDAINRLCTAFIEWLKGKGPPPADEHFLLCFRRPQNEPQWLAAHVLSLVAQTEPERVSRQAVRLLPQIKDVKACRFLISAMGPPGVDPPIARRVLLAASRHPKPDVRSHAALMTVVHDLPDRLSVLGRMRRAERQPGVLAEIDRCESLVRVGHHARHDPETGEWRVWFRWPLTTGSFRFGNDPGTGNRGAGAGGGNRNPASDDADDGAECGLGRGAGGAERERACKLA